MKKAAIFDMDGLLINSEPYWKIAEKKVFGAHGLRLSDDMLREVMGFRLNEVVRHWFNYQPWEKPDHDKTEREVLDEVIRLVLDHAGPMEGVYGLLDYLKKRDFVLAVASSSPMAMIESVIKKLDLGAYFEILWSAEFEDFGKPHPGIFLSTARELAIQPSECMVFEDSANGVKAAKAAGMYCIAVPEEATFNDQVFELADMKWKSLTDYKTRLTV